MFIAQSLDARVVSEQAFVRNTGTNTVTKIRVVDNPSRKTDRNPARFFNAEGWGQIGDQLARLKKGDIVSLSGELKLDKYTDKQGTARQDDVLTVTHFRVQKSEAFFEKKEAPAEPPPAAEEFIPGPGADSDIPF